MGESVKHPCTEKHRKSTPKTKKRSLENPSKMVVFTVQMVLLVEMVLLIQMVLLMVLLI